jgi:hypothetical protein
VTEFRLDYAAIDASRSSHRKKIASTDGDALLWHSVIVDPSPIVGDPDRYAGRQQLEGLAAGREYVVRVASHNMYGWSEPNQASWHWFKTRPHGGSTSPPKPPQPSQPRSVRTEPPPLDTPGETARIRSTTAIPSVLSSSPLSSGSSSLAAVAVLWPMLLLLLFFTCCCC